MDGKKEGKANGIMRTEAEPTNRELENDDGNGQNRNYRKKRLNTEPYEKPMGFIIKKK